MAEPSTITGAACAVTVAICAPWLRSMGLDPVDTVFAAIACTIAQCLLPSEQPRTLPEIARWATGSVLLATIATPWAAPWLAKQVGMVGVDEFRHLVAATFGAFAQPLLVTFRATVLARFQRRSGNA